MDGKDYFTVLDNNISPHGGGYIFQPNIQGRRQLYAGWNGRDNAASEDVSCGNRTKAAAAVEEMGLTDSSPAENTSSLYRRKGQMVPVDYSYGVHFTRVIDEFQPIPTTMALRWKIIMLSWPYEIFILRIMMKASQLPAGRILYGDRICRTNM